MLSHIAKIARKLTSFALYRVAPEILTLMHILWIVLLLGGVFYAFFFYRRFAIAHMYLMGGGLIILAIMRICPLTVLEENLRRKYNPDFTYNNSFMTLHLNKIFKRNWTNRQINIMTAIVYIALYAADALILIYR